MRRPSALYIVLSLPPLVLASPAWARRVARLTYERAPEAGACPDEAVMRSAVTTRLGYDPFVADVEAIVHARLSRTKGALEGVVEFHDDRGQLQGERKLSSRGDDCAELASAMALTISILLDPRAFARPRAGDDPPAQPPPDPHESPFEVDQPKAAPASSTPPDPISLRVSGALLGSVGAAPAPAMGISASVGLGRIAWSVNLETRADFPASRSLVDGTGMRSSLLLGSVVPCRHFGIGVLCLIGSAGVLHGEGVGVGTPDRDASFFAALGARVGAEIPFTSALRARVSTDALIPFTRITLRNRGTEAWTTPAASGALALGLVGLF